MMCLTKLLIENMRTKQTPTLVYVFLYKHVFPKFVDLVFPRALLNEHVRKSDLKPYKMKRSNKVANALFIHERKKTNFQESILLPAASPLALFKVLILNDTTFYSIIHVDPLTRIRPREKQ